MPRIEITPDQAALARELYKLDTLLARRGGDDDGKRPPDRGTTQHLVSLLRKTAMETAQAVEQQAENDASAAFLSAIERGDNDQVANALAQAARRAVWQELTGHPDAWAWFRAFGVNR
ncbi:MAG: hypothetical protein F4Z60_12255 [Chloroflexi bacterium]|nr:hypothetical protein [Chloroflexota bacterium]